MTIQEKRYTDKEFCEMYNVSRWTSKRWRDSKLLKFTITRTNQIRYLQSHIDEFDKGNEKLAKKRAA
jgi:predicted site-specific integrase-resolvase